MTFESPKEPEAIPLIVHSRRTEVVIGGNEKVSGVANTKGGSMKLQGGSQAMDPLFSTYAHESMYTSPDGPVELVDMG